MDTALPAEIWDMILGNLLDPDDCENVSKCSAVLKNVLHLSKSYWLFGKIFQHLLSQFSRNDIFHCREVCRHWRYGVDNFLENNAYHRPAYEKDSNPDFYKTDVRLDVFENFLSRRNLYFRCEEKTAEMERIINESPNYPNCVIVGRSVDIYFHADTQNEVLVKHFVSNVGIHILFLKLCVADLSALETLKLILDLLIKFPNLKRLEFDIHICQSPPDDHIMMETGFTPAQFIKNELSEYAASWLQENDSDQLPKLETIDLQIGGYCNSQLKNVLIGLLISKQLQSLYLNDIPDLPNLKQGNIVDLAVELVHDTEVLLQLVQVDTPIRRLWLGLGCRVHGDAVFTALNNFRATLRNFHLIFKEPDLKSATSPSLAEWCSILTPFANREALLNFPNLKRLTLEGAPPISVNFVCGLRHSLEYLHISVIHLVTRVNNVQKIVDTMGFSEELDLLAIFQNLYACNKSVVYKSNVWKLLPKLRELTVELWVESEPMVRKELSFRRDVYDKINSNFVSQSV